MFTKIINYNTIKYSNRKDGIKIIEETLTEIDPDIKFLEETELLTNTKETDIEEDEDDIEFDNIKDDPPFNVGNASWRYAYQISEGKWKDNHGKVYKEVRIR